MADTRDPQELYEKMTGNLVIKRITRPDNVVTCIITWEGGDVIGLTGDFIKSIVDGTAADLPAEKHGSYIYIGDIRVKIFDYHDGIDVYLAKRIS